MNRSLKYDQDHQWTMKGVETEIAVAVGIRRNVAPVFRGTETWEPNRSEVIKKSDGPPIDFQQQQRLEHLAEHFEEQFSWLNLKMGLSRTSAEEAVRNRNPQYRH